VRHGSVVSGKVNNIFDSAGHPASPNYIVSPVTVFANDISSRNRRALLIPCEGKKYAKETVIEMNFDLRRS
jgi:hypothetical protein